MVANPALVKEENPYAKFFSDFKQDKDSMSYVLIFFCRRYSMVLIVTILPNFRNVQIVSQLWSTLFVMSYIAFVKPFKNMRTTFQEVVNEATTMLAAYPLLAFTEWVYDSDRRMEAGWFLLGCIVFSLLFNLTLMTVVGIKEIYQKIRRKYYELLRKKRLEKERN